MKSIVFVALFALGAGLGCHTASSSTGDLTSDAPATAAIPAEKGVETNPALADDSSAPETDDDAPRILLEDAKKAFDNNEAVFVDTRSATFFENEHVKGAINVPASDFENRYSTIPKDKKIITYCS